jgi:hypothetical protein
MKRSGTLLVAVAALLTALPASSQQPAGDPEAHGGFFDVQRPDQILLSNLITAPVVGPDDRQIGNVDDLLMDGDGRVIGLVMNISGLFGIGSRRIAIAIDQLEFGLVGEAVVEALPQWGPPSTPIVVPGATPEPVPRQAVTWRGITGGQIEYVRVPLDQERLEAAPEFAGE